MYTKIYFSTRNTTKKAISLALSHCLLYQKRALKSSEQVRKAGELGEWVMYLTTPLWPRDRSCLRDAFLASQQHSEVVTSSGNIT